MSGYLLVAPDNTRLAIERVVSVPYSIIGTGASGNKWPQQLGVVG